MAGVFSAVGSKLSPAFAAPATLGLAGLAVCPLGPVTARSHGGAAAAPAELRQDRRTQPPGARGTAGGSCSPRGRAGAAGSAGWSLKARCTATGALALRTARSPHVPPELRAGVRAEGSRPSSERPRPCCSRLAAARSPCAWRTAASWLEKEEAAVLASMIVIWHIGAVLKFRLNRWCQDFNMLMRHRWSKE